MSRPLSSKERTDQLISNIMGDTSNREMTFKKNRASPSSTQASKERYNSESNSPLGLCSDHFRPLEIYCLEPGCHSLVCANCALFGKHKGHRVKEQSELDRETKSMVADLHAVHKAFKVAEAAVHSKESVKMWVDEMKHAMVAKEAEINQYFDVMANKTRMPSKRLKRFEMIP
jgi:hypothetical protein